jgi:hypothetical protein
VPAFFVLRLFFMDRDPTAPKAPTTTDADREHEEAMRRFEEEFNKQHVPLQIREVVGDDDKDDKDEEVETEDGEVVKKRRIRRIEKDIELDGDKSYLLLFNKDGDVRGRKLMAHGYKLTINADKGYFSAGDWYWDNNDKKFYRDAPTEPDTSAADATTDATDATGGGEGGTDDAAAAAAEEARIRALEQQIEEERRRVEAAAAATTAAAAAAGAAGGTAAAAAGGRPGVDPRLVTLAANRSVAEGMFRKPRWHEYINPFAWPKMFARRKAREYAVQGEQFVRNNASPWIKRRLPEFFGAASRPDARPAAAAAAAGAIPASLIPTSVGQMDALVAQRENIPRASEWHRAKAKMLRERGNETWSEARQFGYAETLVRISERWRKMPRWATLGISAGLLAGGVASSVFAPALAGFVGAAALTWRAGSSIATGVGIAAMTHRYLEKRNRKRPALLGAIAGVASGAMVFAAPRAFGEYMMQNFGGIPKTPEILAPLTGAIDDRLKVPGGKTPEILTQLGGGYTDERLVAPGEKKIPEMLTDLGGPEKDARLKTDTTGVVYRPVPEVSLPETSPEGKGPVTTVTPGVEPEGRIRIDPYPEPTETETRTSEVTDDARPDVIDIPPGFNPEPKIGGKESVWSLGAKGLEQLGLLEEGKDPQRFMHVEQRVTERLGLKGDLIGNENIEVPWNKIDDDVPVKFGNLYSNPEFVEAMKKEIRANYKTLAGNMGDMDEFFEKLKFAYIGK